MTEQALDLITSNELQEIAARIESALATSESVRAEALASELKQKFIAMLSAVSPEVKRAVRGDFDSPVALRQAYSLGQVAFAQGFASQISIKKEPNDFREFLNDEKYKKFFPFLLAGDICGVKLASDAKESKESVSRKLKDLRAAGITEFRREGRIVMNFLTPVARAALEAEGVEAQGRSFVASNLLKDVSLMLPAHLQRQQNFASQEERKELRYG